MRYVCKQWSEIVRDAEFIRLHRQISPTGFLVLSPDHYLPEYYINADAATLKVTEVKIPASTRMLCCHNDLILLSDSKNKGIFQVVNLATKLTISLPPMTGLRRPLRNNGNYPKNVGLAIDSSGHYKVVCVSTKTDSWLQVYMTVFTIGVDNAWRYVDLQGKPISVAAKSSILYSPADCFGGFIYWFTTRKSYLGLALDVNTETIYQFSKPNYSVRGDHPMCVIGIGTGLGLIYTRKQFIWEVWKLTDVKSGHWTELGSIDVGELYSQFGCGLCLQLDITPVRLFKGDLWFYGRVGDKFIVVRYNMSDKNFETFPFKISQFPSSEESPSSSKRMIFTRELVASPDL